MPKCTLLCRIEAAVARREIDVDKVKGCEVWEGEAGVEHEIYMFQPLVEVDVGRNVARSPPEQLLEQKAWIGRYPGRETLAWVWGCRKVVLSAYDRWCSVKVTKGEEFVVVKAVGVRANQGEGSSGG